MKFNLIILIGLSVVSCNNSKLDKKQNSFPLDNVKLISKVCLNNERNEVDQNKKVTEIIVKNKADYSETFITGLRELGFEKFELKNDLLLINDKDTAYFPETPKIGKKIVLTGKKGNLAITLEVKRINYTTIDYNVEMKEFGTTNYEESGQANITSGFFFGSESDESEKTGIQYLVTEFSEFKNKECYISIRLGYEKETGPYLLGKLIKNCNGKIRAVDLDNFTTLIEK